MCDEFYNSHEPLLNYLHFIVTELSKYAAILSTAKYPFQGVIYGHDALNERIAQQLSDKFTGSCACGR